MMCLEASARILFEQFKESYEEEDLEKYLVPDLNYGYTQKTWFRFAKFVADYLLAFNTVNKYVHAYATYVLLSFSFFFFFFICIFIQLCF